jgi:hypothetical protein
MQFFLTFSRQNICVCHFFFVPLRRKRRKQGEMNMALRVTPEYITSLKPNEIFVFGSNLAGMHGGGAARMAHRLFGAEMGVGVGRTGQCYAIPTMQGGVETIRPYVDEFIEYAKQHPELLFRVTRIGCGIAGFTNEEIAPLFKAACEMENVSLPNGWREIVE